MLTCLPPAHLMSKLLVCSTVYFVLGFCLMSKVTDFFDFEASIMIKTADDIQTKLHLMDLVHHHKQWLNQLQWPQNDYIVLESENFHLVKVFFSKSGGLQ